MRFLLHACSCLQVLVIGPDAVDELYDLLGDATGSIEDAGLAKWISHRYTLLRSMVADAEDAQVRAVLCCCKV